MEYQVDVHDLKFQLLEWLPTAELLAAERYVDWDVENVAMVIDEAVRIAREEFGPVNEDGDRVGAQWNDGEVKVPGSFTPPTRPCATAAGWALRAARRSAAWACPRR